MADDSLQIEITTSMGACSQGNTLVLTLYDQPSVEEKSLLYKWHVPKDKGFHPLDLFTKQSTIHDRGRFTKDSRLVDLMTRPEHAKRLGLFTKQSFSAMKLPQITQEELFEHYRIIDVADWHSVMSAAAS